MESANKMRHGVCRSFFTRLPVVCAFFILFTSCIKYSPDCELVFYPRVRPLQNSPEGVPAYMVRLYAFYISEDDKYNANWAPASYADADAGIVRHRRTGKVRSYGLMGEQGDGESIHLTLSNSPVLLVAVYNINNDKFYAYRAFEYKPPLREPVDMVLQFQLWKPEAVFTDSYWTVVNGNLEGENEEGTGEE